MDLHGQRVVILDIAALDLDGSSIRPPKPNIPIWISDAHHNA